MKKYLKIVFFGMFVSAFFVPAALAQSTMCPDGTYVSGPRCTLCPDGTYVGGSRCVLQPNGTFTGR